MIGESPRHRQKARGSHPLAFLQEVPADDRQTLLGAAAPVPHGVFAAGIVIAAKHGVKEHRQKRFLDPIVIGEIAKLDFVIVRDTRCRNLRETLLYQDQHSAAQDQLANRATLRSRSFPFWQHQFREARRFSVFAMFQ